ncbi:E3 ubiquitin-protein ligase Topors-like [Psammomys obesus]|uniref:E3 ubiquitin-protein ligase Topors-like n=1 Tax=Psammomys obesus TaxID=48139 RepID=UPI002452B21B|nr:E3 ubiquitin-protein ligase Topors-like [Psammomys obesus]
MAVELSSHCECPNCLGGIQSESDWNCSSRERGDGASYSKSSKKSTLSPIMQRFLSQCCCNKAESANGDDSESLPSEEEISVGVPQKRNISQTPKNTKRKIKPLRELTIQELLKRFVDSGKFQPHFMSLGHFRDQVLVKFRRALYYSGIWVKHVQGSGLEKHFSADYFKRNPSSLYRLIPWLKRELTALYGDCGYTVKNIQADILHHMTKFNLDSESFTCLLEPYLLHHTRHFLHEFTTFVDSSYNMETYDQCALYQCPVTTWMKNKNTLSGPVLPLPENRSLMISQPATKLSKNTEAQHNKAEQRSHSGLKEFPNRNYSSKNFQISKIHQKRADNVCTKDDFKVCTTNSLLDWANSRESRPDTDTVYYKNNNQEKETKGTKLLPDHIQNGQKCETSLHTFQASVDSQQVPPSKYNVRETNILNQGQQVHNQKKEAEKKLEESLQKVFERMPRERTLIKSKSRETHHSCKWISENIHSPTKNDKMLASFRRNKVRCQSSQCVEVASSHHSRRTQRPSSSSTPRPKSWCVESKKQPISRDQSNLYPRGSHKHFIQNVQCRLSTGSLCGCEAAYRKVSLTPVHPAQACLTYGNRDSCTGKGDSQTGRQCDSLSSLQTEKYQSSSKQEMKDKNLDGRAWRIRTVGHKNCKCQCMGTLTTGEFSNELGDLSD